VADDTFITLQVPISCFQNSLFHSLSGIFCLHNGSVSSAVLTDKGQVFQAEQGGIATMFLLVPISEALATHYPTSVHKLFNSVCPRKCDNFLLQNPFILSINDKL
jgi:hypothetical protein